MPSSSPPVGDVIVGGIGVAAVKSGVSSNRAEPDAVYVFVSPINSSKSSHTSRMGTLKKWESMNALSMVGCIGVASRENAVILQLNVSPGNASSTYTGMSSPASNVVLSPCERSKVERCMSACGTSVN